MKPHNHMSSQSVASRLRARVTVPRLLAVTAAVFMLIEVIGTVFRPVDAEEPQVGTATVIPWTPHHYLSYRNRPNFHRGATSHNSLGFRGPEIRAPKPPGVTRIVMLGGSNVYGTSIERDEYTLPAQIQTILRTTYGLTRTEVINAGVEGYTSWESLLSLQFDILDLEPDIVIFCTSVNDVHARLVEPAAYSADNRGRRKQWTMPLFLDQMWTVRQARRYLGMGAEASIDELLVAPTAQTTNSRNRVRTDPMQLLDANPPVYLQRNLTSIGAIARAAGIRIIFGTTTTSSLFSDYASSSHYQRGVRENNAVIRDVARRLKVPVVERENLMPDDVHYWVDGRHVNATGARLMAQMFAEFLAETDMGRRATTEMDQFLDQDRPAISATGAP